MPIHNVPTIPSQVPIFCKFGHRLHHRNAGMDMQGEVICLECLAIVGSAPSRIAGRLLAIALDLAPFPTRAEVYGS